MIDLEKRYVFSNSYCSYSAWEKIWFLQVTSRWLAMLYVLITDIDLLQLLGLQNKFQAFVDLCSFSFMSNASAVNRIQQNLPKLTFNATKSSRVWMSWLSRQLVANNETSISTTLCCQQKEPSCYLSLSSAPKPTAICHKGPIYVAATKQHIGITSVSLTRISHLCWGSCFLDILFITSHVVELYQYFG